jgi:hypothetical protein
MLIWKGIVAQGLRRKTKQNKKNLKVDDTAIGVFGDVMMELLYY